MADSILRLADISKSFAGVHALRGVSFDLLPGEVHALLGENGAGKSTLIKVITGVYQADRGEMYLDGQPAHFTDPRQSRQNGIAASARAVQDANKVGQVIVTGLGTPNQMRDYVKSGACPAFALWNPSDLGYLAIYTLHAIAGGEIAGAPGDTYSAGKLGEYTIAEDGAVLLGPPTVFDAENIDAFDF